MIPVELMQCSKLWNRSEKKKKKKKGLNYELFCLCNISQSRQEYKWDKQEIDDKQKCGHSKIAPRAAIHRERHMYLNFNLSKHWDSSKSDDARNLTVRKGHWSGREKGGIPRSKDVKQFRDKAWVQLWPPMAIAQIETPELA